MSSLSFSQQYTIKIRLITNIVTTQNPRMSIQRSSNGSHLCLHNGAANVIIYVLLFYVLLSASNLVLGNLDNP